MGKNPSIIIREQAAKAKKKIEKIKELDPDNKGPLYTESIEYHCYCGFYNELVKAFMAEGYSAKHAEKHITEWVDNDFIWIGYKDGYKIVGYGDF